MSHDPAAIPPDIEAFVTERQLATLTTLRHDGSPHVVPVGFTWDATARLVRIITFTGSQKAHNLATGDQPRAVVCQVDGARWATFEGRATLTDDAGRVAEAVRRYAARYRMPKERDDRVAIEIEVDRVMGSIP